jgi:cysteinyl-tRNA synthetase
MGRSVEEFQPIGADRVRLYTCGLTVYNYAHIGNLRAYLFTDSLRRALQWKGYDVLHVMNITDVGHLTSDADEGDDKVENAAVRAGKTVWELTEYYTREFQRSLSDLRIMPPSVWSKATDHIPEMLAFALQLERDGYTYELPDGLYFDTSKVPDYGRLALLDLEGQREGARVEMSSGKRNPQDFAVWRRSPNDKQRLMEWLSPWGLGAPGWHLECSVMSLKYLGTPFDIHTGGVDHRQVHHINEIAQNQGHSHSSCSGAKFWMHNEFLLLERDKMSKSTGKFLRLQSLIDWGIHPLVYRYFALMAHYRRQLEFSFESLVAAKTGLTRLLRRIAVLRQRAGGAPEWQRIATETEIGRGAPFAYARERLEAGLPRDLASWIDKLDEAMSEDINTPLALANLNTLLDHAGDPQSVLRVVASYDLALGLGLMTTRVEDLDLRPQTIEISADEVERAITERREARAAKDYAKSDEIRARLTQAGVQIEDAGGGAIWSWIPRKSD